MQPTSNESFVAAFLAVRAAMDLENAAWQKFVETRSPSAETVWALARDTTDQAWAAIWELKRRRDRQRPGETSSGLASSGDGGTGSRDRTIR